MPTGKAGQAGFTYLGLLIAVVFFGLGAVGAARLMASTEQAERERELIFVGHQFREAIRSYVQSGGKYPAALDDLVLDKRTPANRRHLRRIFIDPITGKAEWGLVKAPEGGVMGVHSLSPREPRKRANFSPEDADFTLALQANAKAAESSVKMTPTEAASYSYQDWKFIYRPNTAQGRRNPFDGAGGM